MKIYTKTGDAGETGLFGGQRVSKDALRIEAYGTVDELNAVIGLARASYSGSTVNTELAAIQQDLFQLGADLATPRSTTTSRIKRIGPPDAERLERVIDRLDAELEPLRSFILPGGSVIAAQLHVARTVCRRAERLVATLGRQEDIGSDILVYLNRLSDLLFVMARFANKESGIAEQIWVP